MVVPLLAGMGRLALSLGRGAAAIKDGSASIGKLTTGILGLVHPLDKLIDVMGRMDRLQVRSLAIGTTANKFLSVNNDSLKKLRGGFFENANEMFANFEAGITENSDSLNALQNRMRLTGQKTEVARELSVKMLNYTGNNIDAIDHLAKVNMQLAKSSMMTNERLLNLVKSLDDVTADRSLFGEAAQFSELAQTLGAAVGAGGEEMVAGALRAMMDSKNLAATRMMGMEDLNLNNTKEAAQTFIANLRKAEAFKNNLLGNDSSNSRIKLQTLEALGIKESLISMTNLMKKLDSPGLKDKDLRTKEDKFYDSFNAYSEEFGNYANYGIIFYEKMLDGFGAINKWLFDKGPEPKRTDNVYDEWDEYYAPSVGDRIFKKDLEMWKNKPGIQGTSKEMVAERVKLKNDERAALRAEEVKRLAKESNKHLASIDLSLTGKNKSSNPMDFMQQVLYQAGRTMQRNKDYEAATLKQLEMNNEYWARANSNGGIPFTGR